MVIQNVSSLSTTPGASGDVAVVLGYYSAGDGGGGQFYWAASSPVSPNGGTVFSANGSGVWIKILNGSVSVKEFGAKGDGVTDDTTFLQNAAKYVSEFHLDLYFPSANYLIGGSISFSGLTAKTDYSCSVSGENATLIKKGDENVYFAMFRFTGANTNVKVSGLAFDGRRDQIKSHWFDKGTQFGAKSCDIDKRSIAIVSENVSSAHIDNCHFVNIHGRAIYDYYTSKFITVTNSYFKNLAQDACVSEASTTLNVSNCHFEDIGILPETFFVNGVEYAFNGATKWYYLFGDAVLSRNTYTKVSDCTFININRISVTTDIPAAGIQQHLICSSCSILHDHPRLRCSNPQGSIWMENGYSALIANNNIKYVKRADDDLQGYAIVCAQSSATTESRLLIDGNIVDATLTNKPGMTGIQIVNAPNRQVFISNNSVYGPFIFCLNFSFQRAATDFVRVSVTNNYFDNTSTAANSAVINREFLNEGTGTIQEFTLKSNFLKQGNLTDSRDTYLFGVEAIYERNYIENNNFNGASISLRYNRPTTVCIKGNIGVTYVRSLLDTADILTVEITDNEIGAIQMQNQFATNIPRLSGHILRNKLKNIAIHGGEDLTISDNILSPVNSNGIHINPWGKTVTSNKVRILRNFIIVAPNTTGVAINNGPSRLLTNSLISNNTIDGESNASTGIAFATAGNRSNLVLQDNTVVRVGTAIVNPA